MSEDLMSFGLIVEPTNTCPKCGKQLTTISFRDAMTDEIDHKTEYCTKECGFVRYE